MTNYSMQFDLSNREILVIGIGGIGSEIASALGTHGATVHVADKDTDAVQQAAENLGGSGRPFAADITDSAEVAAISENLPELDGVVLTAAMNVRKRIADYTNEDFDRVVDLNLRGSFNVIRAFGSAFAKRNRGSIVAFSSVRSFVVEPGQGMYAASKAGVNQLVKTAAAEFGHAGVRVNAVAPGVVETPLTRVIKDNPEWYQAYASKGALNRWARPSELTGAVVYLLSDAASFVTGSVLTVDGGWTAMDGRFTPPIS